MNKLILKLESLLFFGLVVWLYQISGYSWAWFFVLILFPDISMLAYLRNPKFGAYAYNIFHNYIPPILLATAGYQYENRVMFSVALIWMAHISIDRFFGFGLKETTGFKNTHLGRIQ